MNHLAHALLSGSDADMMLGGLMGDFLHGGIDPALPASVRHGIALHRAIDSHTDAHPTLAELRARFDPPYRRYAGIITDIWFDHLLARDFKHWSGCDLHDYSDRIQRLLATPSVPLPERMASFARYMRAHDLPAAYADRALIARVYAGVGTRLRHANPLAHAMAETERLEAPLAEAFATFFPYLLDFARAWRDAHRPAA